MEKVNKKIVLISIISAFIIFILIFAAPFLLFSGSVLWEMFFNIPEDPKVEYGEFPFEIVYEYNGKKGIIKDTIVCEYEGSSFALDGGNTRDWNCYIKDSEDYGYYYIDTKNQPDLYIYVPMDAEYYMGAPDSDIENARPYIYYDVYEQENTYDEELIEQEELIEEIELVENEDPREKIDIKIIEWKPSRPLENNFNTN